MILPIDELIASWLLFAARFLIALLFLVSGTHKAIWYQKAVQEFELAGIPLIAISLPATIILHISGAACLVAGIYTVVASLALALFTALATILVHAFWRFEGAERLERSRIFMGNFAIVGGLLSIAAIGTGALVPG